MDSLVSFLVNYPAAFPWVAGLFGLAIGSFLNVVIYRLPVMMERRWQSQCQELINARPATPAPPERFDLVIPRSRCPHCGHAITALENIPLLSFLWLRGKCVACRKSISWRYPAIEFLTGVLSAWVAWHFGFNITALAGLLLTWGLIALAFIDYDHQLLPDDITLPLLWLGLLFNVAGVFVPLPAAVIGAVAGYLFLWIVYQLFKLVTGKEGMGYGDFKLLAALGAWLGWQNLPLTILLASFVGAVIGIASILFMGHDRRTAIPFGPFLCVAGWIALMWGNVLTHLYLQFARITG
ncbi:MAG: prepilin peptidase [Gammaproteobacteria bacterium]|nr:prepilin peptidase [Gammaproteobacteria bacterium]